MSLEAGERGALKGSPLLFCHARGLSRTEKRLNNGGYSREAAKDAKKFENIGPIRQQLTGEAWFLIRN